MSQSDDYYTVKWPHAKDYRIRSVSGVVVESNIQNQISFHFYNEIREIEPVVAYDQHGARSSEPRSITYVREVADTLVLSEGAARQFRDVLNTYFAEQSSEALN